MAEGLEEESKKSLQMEAELEKQLHVFESDKKALKAVLANKDAKCQELELEIQKVRAECDALKSRIRDPSDTAPPLTSSVAKVVQPTATVSSVPVSGPSKFISSSFYINNKIVIITATGIAQSVAPGQAIRQTAITPTPIKVYFDK